MRADGTSELIKRRQLGPFKWVRMRLRRADGAVYLERWGPELGWRRSDGEWRAAAGLFVHRMDAPDPGLDVHDHPWWFVTVPIIGQYIEHRCDTRMAPVGAWRGTLVRRGCPRGMRLDECHRISAISDDSVWTVVLHGPWRREWGFYLPAGYVSEQVYDETVRAARRDLWNEEHPA